MQLPVIRIHIKSHRRPGHAAAADGTAESCRRALHYQLPGQLGEGFVRPGVLQRGLDVLLQLV
jgi:hypothetical protein